MITNNTDIERLIYDEAYHFYPELFGYCTSASPYKKRDLNSDSLLSDIFSGFDALPEITSSVAQGIVPSLIPDLPILLTYDAAWPLPYASYPHGFFSDSKFSDLKTNPPFGIAKIRSDFPILEEKVNSKKLVWFDNAATTQKPSCVIDRLRYFYEHENSNVHRAAHTLARRTTDAYEGARRVIAAFLNAPHADNIVFVRGATEGINLVAHSYGLSHISEGDEILISQLEHHANIVPWQFLCTQTGAKLKTIPIDDSGQIILSEYQELLTPRTKIVAFGHVSNVLGTISPAEEMIRLAHNAGAKVLLDGAQAVSHLPVDVKALDCDFYVFSGHKIFGPTGIGILYGKAELLEAMTPYQGGGNMISDVTLEESKFKEAPHKFEAGTGSIADAVALGSAVTYVAQIGLNAIYHYEHDLLQYMTESMTQIPGMIVIGNAASKSGIISFHVKGHESDDIALLLDREGIAVRSGHHCAQPILRRFGCEKIVRASLALYNTFEEVDAFISVLRQIISVR